MTDKVLLAGFMGFIGIVSGIFLGAPCVWKQCGAYEPWYSPEMLLPVILFSGGAVSFLWAKFQTPQSKAE